MPRPMPADVIEIRDLDTSTDPFPAASRLPRGAELTWSTGADKLFHVVSMEVPADGDMAARTDLTAWLAKQVVPAGERFVLRSSATPAGGTRLTSLLVSDALVVPSGTFVAGACREAPGDSSRGPHVSVRVSPDADATLRSATGSRVGHTIVILIDGEVLATPIVTSAFGGPSVSLSPPDLPEPEAVAWCHRVAEELSR